MNDKDVHGDLFALAREHGATLELVCQRLHAISERHGEFPPEAEKAYYGIAAFLAQYQPPGLREKWDSEGR